MRLTLVALAVLAAMPAVAQPVMPPVVPRPYDPAPWWMREPVLASLGSVRTEVRANRGRFAASFQAVERTAADAVKAAGDKVRALGTALRGFGDAVRVESSFSIQPLYEQYKDKDGRIAENRRADQIDRYEANANLRIELRDTALAEQVYARVVAARPASTSAVQFFLQPENSTRTELYGLAVADAARRARLSVEGAGPVRLGPVKLIDPTGRACETDILVAGAPRDGGQAEAYDVPPPPAPPPPPPPAPFAGSARRDAAAAAIEVPLPLQPPLQELTARACVIYALVSG